MTICKKHNFIDQVTDRCCQECLKELGEPEQPTPSAGSAGSTPNPHNEGVWFKSAVSGMLYQNHRAAGSIEAVIIDGVWYDRNEYAPIEEA